jgi:hypothetical protein
VSSPEDPKVLSKAEGTDLYAEGVETGRALGEAGQPLAKPGVPTVSVKFRPGISPSTVARIAGNLLSGIMAQSEVYRSVQRNERNVKQAVELARMIVAEVERTQGGGE